LNNQEQVDVAVLSMGNPHAVCQPTWSTRCEFARTPGGNAA